MASRTRRFQNKARFQATKLPEFVFGLIIIAQTLGIMFPSQLTLHKILHPECVGGGHIQFLIIVSRNGYVTVVLHTLDSR